jgi:hypothetical protein|tara:strand:- start:135 stop:461 length:327 start_codon:yes stop_codon:yes gene_type:complete
MCGWIADLIHEALSHYVLHGGNLTDMGIPSKTEELIALGVRRTTVQQLYVADKQEVLVSTKLTLRLDEALIQVAKEYSRKSGRVSRPRESNAIRYRLRPEDLAKVSRE